MGQLHKRFSNEQVKEILQKYVEKRMDIHTALALLKIGRTQFTKLVKQFRENPKTFSIEYARKTNKRISQKTEMKIIEELEKEKSFIANKDMSIRTYNYSFIQRLLEEDGHNVSHTTITKRAKEYGYYIPKKQKAKAHDREVITNAIGELIQHDASLHQFSPCVDEKWYLITSLDDYSRALLYYRLLKRESSVAHIRAAEHVFLTYGVPFRYYPDSHSIFRFVQGRDSNHREHYLTTDSVNTQWKQVLEDCGVHVDYALSPQAKGKIERPYRWIQDNLTRLCARKDVRDIRAAQRVLNTLVNDYNQKWVHSTTKEIPMRRFEEASGNGLSLFRSFIIPNSYETVKDIFSIRIFRKTDAYRRISVKGKEIRFNGAPVRGDVELRIYPNENGFSDVRFWVERKLCDQQKIKTSELGIIY